MIGPTSKIPTLMAKMEIMSDATVACTWTIAMFPMIILMASGFDFMLPKLACVQRRDASVMSRFPFRPRSAGTTMKSCGIVRKTSHDYAKKSIRIHTGLWWTLTHFDDSEHHASSDCASAGNEEGNRHLQEDEVPFLVGNARQLLRCQGLTVVIVVAVALNVTGSWWCVVVDSRIV